MERTTVQNVTEHLENSLAMVCLSSASGLGNPVATSKGMKGVKKKTSPIPSRENRWSLLVKLKDGTWLFPIVDDLRNCLQPAGVIQKRTTHARYYLAAYDTVL
ncbi:hypothetical protein JTE90_019379 [Oedothorax gibbosus]|uniref:Uncharacterized protein n=1 Tax=Oedothorax gibbosus TaxID=931172 RepID=A0AAV6TLJ0_9ARAC|nr:hypothetical protein JTE90_019379 [Oedothorax gibbosus]